MPRFQPANVNLATRVCPENASGAAMQMNKQSKKPKFHLVLSPGLKPNGPKWTPEATLLFKSLVVVGDTPLRLYMIVVERPADGGALSVKLVDTTGEELNGRDIGTELAARLSTTVAGNCNYIA